MPILEPTYEKVCDLCGFLDVDLLQLVAAMATFGAPEERALISAIRQALHWGHVTCISVSLASHAHMFISFRLATGLYSSLIQEYG